MPTVSAPERPAAQAEEAAAAGAAAAGAAAAAPAAATPPSSADPEEEVLEIVDDNCNVIGRVSRRVLIAGDRE